MLGCMSEAADRDEAKGVPCSNVRRELINTFRKEFDFDLLQSSMKCVIPRQL